MDVGIRSWSQVDRADVDLSGRPRLLVVEAESDTRELLVFNLTGEGFDVVACERGEQALVEVGRQVPDLIVLSRDLQGLDGLEVCRAIKSDREAGETPVIMVSSRTAEPEVLAIFEHGADDFLPKPVSYRVLKARIQALFRRRSLARHLPEPGAIQIDSLLINPERHEVRIGDKPVDLTATEFKLLVLLARARGRVLTREQIVRSVHDSSKNVTERSVDVLIVMLRRKLGDQGRNVETVRGVGYRLNLTGGE